jgi:hypothetical protein
MQLVCAKDWDDGSCCGRDLDVAFADMSADGPVAKQGQLLWLSPAHVQSIRL